MTPLPQLEIKPYDHQPPPPRLHHRRDSCHIENHHHSHVVDEDTSASHTSSVSARIYGDRDRVRERERDQDRSREREKKDVVYIETFDVLLCDIKGPLGHSSGGLRRYFKKLLENFVSTGCVFRTVNKIGICVHGTVEVLDIVTKVLDHAVRKPLTPLHTRGMSSSHQHPYSSGAATVAAGGAGGQRITWKYRSTGRTVRQGVWGRSFTTRLCENAQRGKYSPRCAGEK